MPTAWPSTPRVLWACLRRRRPPSAPGDDKGLGSVSYGMVCLWCNPKASGLRMLADKCQGAPTLLMHGQPLAIDPFHLTVAATKRPRCS